MRVSEVYTSLQGEGPRVGIPTQFVRMGGCNLRCPSWPCDSQFAIDPAFRKEWVQTTPEKLLAKGDVENWPTNICLTGGEPFLQPYNELEELVRGLTSRRYKVECFSNGTLLYPPWATKLISFVMDWKLTGAGDDLSKYTKVRFKNLKQLGTKDALKLTVASRTDFDEAIDFYKTHVLFGTGTRAGMKYPLATYVGAVWGLVEEKELAEWLLKEQLPLRMNVQLHNHIWDRTQRGI